MSNYDIAYRFTASGQGDVRRAFQSIGQAANQRARSEEGAARAAERSAERAARAKEREVEKVARAEKRRADVEVKQQERAKAHVGRIRDRYFADSQKAEERAAKKATDVRMREEKRALTQRAALQRAQARSQSVIDATNDRLRENRNRTIGRVASATADAAMLPIAGGAALVGAAARKELILRSKARSMSVGTRGAGETMVDPETLAREFQATAKANPGVSAESVADAVDMFRTKTGRLDLARQWQGTFATTASATGADTTEIAGAAADLFQKFDIKSIDEMREALTALTFQGKKGAFELKDAAAEFPSIASAAQRFGMGKGAQSVKTLGGLMQIAREATPSGAEAGTAVEQMFTQLVAKSGKLKSAEWGGESVKVFDEKGNAREIQDVLVDVIHGVGGKDMEAKKQGLQGVFDVRGIRAISPLIDTYSQALKQGLDPVKAMREKMDEAINATGSWSDMQEDAALQQQDSGAKLTAAWESLSAEVGDQVIPGLTSLIDRLVESEGAIDALAGTAGVVVEMLTMFIDELAKIPMLASTFRRKEGPIDEQIRKKETQLERADESARREWLKSGNIGPAPLTDKQRKLREELTALELEGELLRQAAGTSPEGQLDQSTYEREYEKRGHDGPGAWAWLQGGALAPLLPQGETGKQVALREAYERGKPATGKDEQDRAAAELLAAAGELKAAASKMTPRGDPLGGFGGWW